MSRDLGWDVPDLEKLYVRKLWADFSFPKEIQSRKCAINNFWTKNPRGLLG